MAAPAPPPRPQRWQTGRLRRHRARAQAVSTLIATTSSSVSPEQSPLTVSDSRQGSNPRTSACKSPTTSFVGLSCRSNRGPRVARSIPHWVVLGRCCTRRAEEMSRWSAHRRTSAILPRTNDLDLDERLRTMSKARNGAPHRARRRCPTPFTSNRTGLEEPWPLWRLERRVEVHLGDRFVHDLLAGTSRLSSMDKLVAALVRNLPDEARLSVGTGASRNQDSDTNRPSLG
jgi:hypothetical protein